MPAIRDNRHGWILVTLAVLLALFSTLASVNEYTAMFGREMAGAYDCDGPGFVLLFTIPPLLLAIAGIIVSVRRGRIGSNPAANWAAAVGVIVLLALSARLPAVLTELRRNAAPQSPCR